MKPRRPVAVKLPTEAEIAAKLRGMRAAIDDNANYRHKSLRMFGLICARCAREFDQSTAHLLTVHHRDGNHSNNPPDGSNWENLCSHCHDDVHSRGELSGYLSRQSEKR
jgi:5-methylcytosine-specific restriction endonuclease McrA